MSILRSMSKMGPPVKPEDDAAVLNGAYPGATNEKTK
jgi:hypothetical protein